jgi:acyl dehydratase
MPAHLGERIERRVMLHEPEIAEFARLCGDANPLHSDAAYAAETRFGGIIACGPQYASLLMGLVASHYSRDGAMLGLEFTFRFRKAVHAGDTIDLCWEVIEVTPKASLQGDLVTLEGRITNQDGVECLGATGKVLVTGRL